MNLTDVDDKIIKRAAEQGKTITRGHRAGHRDLPSRSRVPAHRARRRMYPKATDYIPQMIALVERLIERGVAYQGRGRLGLLRDRPVSRLRPALAPRHARGQERARACAQDDYTKENAQDFALWKAAKPEDEATGAAWDSPWGRGRPGWHLECSAMAMELLGETLDLHCGGDRPRLPASRGRDRAVARRRRASRSRACWCHGAFLLTDGAKMAKRVGNVVDRAGAARGGRLGGGAPALRVQHALPEGAEPVGRGARGVDGGGAPGRRLRRPAATGTLRWAARRSWRRRRTRRWRRREAALFDDLNAPEALAALFNFIRRANAELDRQGRRPRRRSSGRGTAFERINGVLDIVPERAGADPALAAWIEERIGGAAGGAGAAGFRRGGPDPGRARRGAA